MRYVTLAVEGITDEAVAARLCEHVGLEVLAAYIAGGKQNLDSRIHGYNHAARFQPWFVLRDLNSDAACAPELRSSVLPAASAHMCFRIAVTMVESWLLADRLALARFLAVPSSRIPLDPDLLPRPKRTLVQIARSSRRRSIVHEIVPPSGVSAEVGPGYSSQLIAFCREHWDPERAASRSGSLRRCLVALRALA